MTIEAVTVSADSITIKYSLPFQRTLTTIFLTILYVGVIRSQLAVGDVSGIPKILLPIIAIANLNCWISAGPGYWAWFEKAVSKQLEN